MELDDRLVAVVRLFRPATTAWLSAVTLALGGGRHRDGGGGQSRVRAYERRGRTGPRTRSARSERAGPTLADVKAAFGALTAFLVMGASPAVAGASGAISGRDASTVLAQASPSPSPATTTETPTAPPSPGEEGDQGGLSTGAGIVIAAFLVGGLLLMRSRLLRR